MRIAIYSLLRAVVVFGKASDVAVPSAAPLWAFTIPPPSVSICSSRNLSFSWQTANLAISPRSASENRLFSFQELNNAPNTRITMRFLSPHSNHTVLQVVHNTSVQEVIQKGRRDFAGKTYNLSSQPPDPPSSPSSPATHSWLFQETQTLPPGSSVAPHSASPKLRTSPCLAEHEHYVTLLVHFAQKVNHCPCNDSSLPNEQSKK